MLAKLKRMKARRRRGTVVVLAAVLVSLLVAVIALSVEIGYLCVIKTQLQRATDAGALAGAGALQQPIGELEVFEYTSPTSILSARGDARQFVRLNQAGQRRFDTSQPLDVNLNVANTVSGDVVLGRLFNPSNLREPLLVTEVNPNSVQVRIPMTQHHQNGAVPLFFSRAFGMYWAGLQTTATATIVEFPTVLPIVTAIPRWNSLADSQDDQYAYLNGQVVKGQDFIPEIIIYPGNWDGNDLPPGNFGTVQIGAQSGTTVLRSQIDMGPAASDFDYYGGSLYTGMELAGETGISADIETAFTGGSADGRTYSGIIGDIRFMPLYSDVVGNGHNARFLIHKFVAVRIMEAMLKGGTKRVVVQPAVDTDDLRPRIRLTR